MHPLSDKAKLIESLQKYKRHHCAVPVQATIAHQVDKSLSQDDVFAHLLGFIYVNANRCHSKVGASQNQSINYS
jgi:hypothetical protein